MTDWTKRDEADIERIMTRHWDLAACPCWLCKAGRAHGLHPREEYLHEEQQRRAG